MWLDLWKFELSVVWIHFLDLFPCWSTQNLNYLNKLIHTTSPWKDGLSKEKLCQHTASRPHIWRQKYIYIFRDREIYIYLSIRILLADKFWLKTAHYIGYLYCEQILKYLQLHFMYQPFNTFCHRVHWLVSVHQWEIFQSAKVRLLRGN